MTGRSVEMLWMDGSTGTCRSRDQGLRGIWRTVLHSPSSLMSLPSHCDAPTLCLQSLTVTFPLIATSPPPTLSAMLSSTHCCRRFLLSLSLNYYIQVASPVFLHPFCFLRRLRVVTFDGQLAGAVEFSSAADPDVNIKSHAQVCEKRRNDELRSLPNCILLY